MSTTKEYLFDVAGAVERLDKVLFALFSDHDELKEISRSQIKNAITKGHVSVNGKAITKAGAEVKSGMQIAFRREGYASDKITPFQMQLEILHEDSDLIVINKPAGLSMHPGAGRDQKTLLHGIISKLSDALGDRPGIVHRLDKDTTGIVVVAKNERTLFALSKQFAERTVDRFYTALVVARNTVREWHDRSLYRPRCEKQAKDGSRSRGR
jgi:23S rRNA pseudouridine1911/1915/1917 synthase